MSRIHLILGCMFLAIVADSGAAATCSPSVADITDTTSPVSNLGRPRAYQLTVSGATTAGRRELYLFLPGTHTPVAAWGSDALGKTWECPDVNTCTLTAFCIPPGTYDLYAWVVCDGGIAGNDYTEVSRPVQVPDEHPTVTITGATPVSGNQYLIDFTRTLPVGIWPSNILFTAYHPLGNGSFSDSYWSFSNSSLIEAKPGDKVVAHFYTCSFASNAEIVTSSIVIPAPPSVEVAVLDGAGQRAVIGEPAEKPLRVKFTASDPSFDLRTISAEFQVIAVPSGATGYGAGATDTLVSSLYSVPVAGDGTAAATFLAGTKAGDYIVSVKSPMSLTGNEARFITTAVQPDSVAILKDTLDVADLAGTYAVSSSAATKFHSVGLDAAGAKIGPMKSIWSVSATGNGATRGDGTLSPVSPASRSVTFQPAKPGQMKLAANPALAHVQNASAELFITGLYLSLGAFDPANPADELPAFVPGSNPDGTSVSLSGMPQRATLHVLTGGSSRGYVTFQLENVSAYPGVAMNWPINNPDTAPDLMLENGAQQGATFRVPFSGTGDTSVGLLVRDYAAKGRVRVVIESGKNTYSLASTRIPADNNGNGIADAGWNALANSATGEMTHVSDSYASTADSETDPVVSGLPTQGITGDGLSVTEEYRGFVVRGRHRRLHPLRKDFFIVIRPEDDILDDRLTELPLTIHELLPYEAQGDLSPVINPNRSTVSGASLQRGLLVRNRADPPMFETAAGIVSADFEARGWTFQQGDNINLIDFQTAALALVQSPNETLVSESFDSNFWRHYISYGDNGIRDTAVAPTDMDVPENRVIYGGNDWLQSQPNSLNAAGDDFQTAAITTVCGSASDRPWRAMTVDEVIEAYRNTFLHEAAHGLDVEHDRTECSLSIMSDEAAVPVHRSLTPTDTAQIRIHRKHN